MAKIPSALQLSAAEVDALMTRSRHCRIATIGPGTEINLTPMTFGWAGGKAYIFGRGQKIANLRRSPTATVLVDVGEAWRELRGVMLQGSATVLEDADAEARDPDLAEAQRNIAQKHQLKTAYEASAAGRSRRWIVFEPTRIVTWDNAKLPRGNP